MVDEFCIDGVTTSSTVVARTIDRAYTVAAAKVW